LIAIEAALGGPGKSEGDFDMAATIGTFTKSENGFTGTIRTLTLNVKARFVAAEKENEKAPDYRVFTASRNNEFGAAWKKRAKETGSDLRQPRRNGGRQGGLFADLVPLSPARASAPPPGGALACPAIRPPFLFPAFRPTTKLASPSDRGSGRCAPADCRRRVRNRKGALEY
jgi:hypothetical protein